MTIKGLFLGRFPSALGLGPFQRRFLLFCADALLLPTVVWLSFWFRLDHPRCTTTDTSWLFPAIWLIGLPLYCFSGQYKGLTRYVGSLALYRLALRNCLLVLILVAFGWLFGLPMPPLNSWLLLFLLLTGFTGAVRFGLRDVLLSFQSRSPMASTRVAIYGAGSAGVQLAAALRLANTHTVEVFLDDDPAFWGRSINGVPIEPPHVLQNRSGELDQVLLAIPSLSRSRRRRIVDAVQESGIPVLQIPSMKEITSGRARMDALRPIQGGVAWS